MKAATVLLSLLAMRTTVAFSSLPPQRAPQSTFSPPPRMTSGAASNLVRPPLPSSASTALTALPLTYLRGGALAALPPAPTPASLFNRATLCLLAFGLITKWGRLPSSKPQTSDPVSSKYHANLRGKYLPLFYLLRLSDWLQGPYFYSVYATKTLANGASYPMHMISRLFLTGFASTAIAGPYLGRMSDKRGRKKATLAFCILYALGAMSTRSNILHVLFLGRVLSGLGTSLLFSAPESWLVGESTREPGGEADLGKTFGMAYAGDSIVAIAAGQLASAAAERRGARGPFELSAAVLAAGAVGVASVWGENVASNADSGADAKSPTIRDGLKIVLQDRRLLLVGLMQASFEASMYTFVINWPPALAAAVAAKFGASAAVPYGGIFSR